MPNRNILSGLKVVNLLTAAVWTATSASKLLDRAGFQSAAILLVLGANGGTAFDASNKITPTLEESDTTADADFTTVAAANMTVAPTVIDADGEASTVQTVEYRGSKRYIRLKLTEAGTISIPIAVVGLLGRATNEPVAAVADGVTAT